MRRRPVLVAVVLTATVLAGCKAPSAKTSFTSTSVVETSTSTTVAPATASLEAKLLTDVPDGYAQETDDVGDTGPSDLAKAVRDDGKPDAQTALTAAGFVAGYQRLWTKADGAFVAFLFQFQTTTGAQNYLKRLIGAASGSGDATPVTEFAVPGIPGAKGYAGKSPDGDSVVVAFARGVYAAQIVVTGIDANPTLANSLATQQYKLLA